MLNSKNIVVTGVAREDSISAAVAQAAVTLGARVVVTALERDLEEVERIAARISSGVRVMPLDLTNLDEVEAFEREVHAHLGEIDGIVHGVAFAPRLALEQVMAVPAEQIQRAMTTSVWTYSVLAESLLRLRGDRPASLVGLDFDSQKTWPVYNWMGPCKAALRSLNGYLARDLGPLGCRANLVAAGPLRTRAASGISNFDVLLDRWERQAPLSWDPEDATAVAETVCFLLSDHARQITGEVLHVDGGFHAMATTGD